MKTRGFRSVIAASLVEHGTVRGQVRAREAVDVVFSEIARLVTSGEKVEIRSFGVFARRDRPAYTAHNPKTGRKVQVPPTWRVTFRPGKYLRGRSA